VITQQRRSKHRHLNGEKGGEYDSFKNRKKLHATISLQREERQRLEATTTKRCSSAGECRNAIPNCGRHRQPTTEQHARTASWVRTDRATGSNKGTSESSKRMIDYSTQKRVLPERALIYTQQSVFTEKTKHQKPQPHGVVTKMRWRYTKRAARARTALLIIVPSHPVNFPIREITY